MSQLNTKTRNKTTKKAVSNEGNVQYAKGPEQLLFETAVNFLLGKDSFYTTSNEHVSNMLVSIDELVKKGQENFVANLALFSRTEGKIRSAPVMMVNFLLGSARQNHKALTIGRQLVRDVINRPDELTDMLSYALNLFGGKKALPLAIKKGIADAFGKFDEYQFGKYSTALNRKTVKLTDAMLITHPKPKDKKQAALYKKVLTNTLSIPKTWETEITKAGQAENVEAAKQASWESLIREGKLGYMALIRNLRNMEIAGIFKDKELLAMLVQQLISPDRIHKSGVLPFQISIALEQVSKVGTGHKVIRDALNQALELSVDNIPDIDSDKVWIIVDGSGSMGSGHSVTEPLIKAAIFASAIYKKCVNGVVTVFGTRAKHVKMTRDFSANIDAIHRAADYGGTYLQSALDLKPTLGFEPELVFVLSDGDLHPTNLQQMNETLKGAAKFCLNFQASDSTPFNSSQGWTYLSGLSNAVFKYLDIIGRKNEIIELLKRPYPYTNYTK